MFDLYQYTKLQRDSSRCPTRMKCKSFPEAQVVVVAAAAAAAAVTVASLQQQQQLHFIHNWCCGSY